VLAFGYGCIQTHADKGNANSHIGRPKALAQVSSSSLSES
jgi:UDP-N-acetylmuramyl pentapeptide synthase